LQNISAFKRNSLIFEHIYANLSNINEQSRKYIIDVLLIINNEFGIDKILSLILFGSQIPEYQNDAEKTIISDCDLLIIFKNRVKNHHIRKIEKYIVALEHLHKLANSTLVDKFLGIVYKKTGMFVSHFLTKQKYWNNLIFHKIFRVHKIFSTLFAPKKIVICSVVANSAMLYGLDLRQVVKNVEISSFDIIKSLFMNLAITSFAIPLSPFKSFKSTEHILEAIKWSLRASNYYAFEDSQPLIKIVKRFTLIEKSKMYKRHADVFYNRFLKARSNPSKDWGFILRSPFRIFKIHLKGMLYKKLLKKMRLKQN
jgi:hypothetical protein